MDAIIRTNSGAPLITPWSARGMSNEKFTTLQASDARKREIEGDAFKAFEAPTMKASEKDKGFIKQKIESIRDRLKILRKLFSGNPKEMAKALAQVFKELKQALKEYKAATDKEIGISADVVGEMMMPPAAATISDADKSADPAADGDKTDDAKAEDTQANEDTTSEPPADAQEAAEDAPTADTSADAPTDTTNTTSPVSDKSGLYAQVEQRVVQMAGNDGLDFVHQIKGLVNEIEDKMLTPARIQMKAQKSDKDTDKAFEEVDKELKELRQQMEDIERDIKREAPSAGQTVDIAA